MRVTVLYFAAAREAAGTSQDTLELPGGADVRSAFEELGRRHAALAPVLASCRAAVDEEFAAGDAVLEDGATLAVLPPVSGG